jgi:hypothetical protein
MTAKNAAIPIIAVPQEYHSVSINIGLAKLNLPFKNAAKK